MTRVSVVLHKPEWFVGSNLKYTTTTYNVDDTVATSTDPRGAVTTYTYGLPSTDEKRSVVTSIAYAPPSPNPTPSNPLHVADVADVILTY